MAWYSTGTATFTNSSTTVTGSGTSWNAPGAARAGDAIHAPDGAVYEITGIVSDTEITISPAYQATTVSGAAYRIQPTRGWVVATLEQVNTLLANFEAAVNGPLAGKYPDGTEAAPALSFAADQDTGIWRKGANTIGVSAGGSEVVEIGTGGMTLDGLLSGTAVVQSDTDDTPGRVITTDYGYSRAQLRVISGTATLSDPTGVGSWLSSGQSFVSVPLSPSQPDADYAVHVDLQDASDMGSLGSLEVYDKAINGFKIRATGSAAAVDVHWTLIKRAS